MTLLSAVLHIFSIGGLAIGVEYVIRRYIRTHHRQK